MAGLDGQYNARLQRLERIAEQNSDGSGGDGGSGSVEYAPVLAETTKSVTEYGWVASFSGGPILEGTSYRVIVNGVTYEPLIGTAGDLSYICLGNTYVDDATPSGDYPFGIFYKNDTLSAWLETGESITMQIDQIIQLVPVPSPTDADTGKVLTANNGKVEWKELSKGLIVPVNDKIPSFNTLENLLLQGVIPYLYDSYIDDDYFINRILPLNSLIYEDGTYFAFFSIFDGGGAYGINYISSDRTSDMLLD